MPWPFVVGKIASEATKPDAPTSPDFQNVLRNFSDRMRTTMNDRLPAAQAQPFGAFDFPRGYPQGPGRTQAFTTLMEILNRQGQTDPRNANRQRVGIQRGTQTMQGDISQQMAMMGPGMAQSGMGQALRAAAGQAGEERMAGFEAQETAAAEDRMRNDLMLWLQMFVNPSLDAEALQSGIQMANRQYDSQRDAAVIGAAGQLGGNILGNWNTLFPSNTPTTEINMWPGGFSESGY